MNSEEYKNKIKESLEDVLENIDNYYYNTKIELEKEILNKKENIEKTNKETLEIYNLLTKEMCIKLIKKILPLRIKLFNKIEWAGKGIIRNGRIIIWFTFNNINHNFYCEFNLYQIKNLLNYF